MATLEHINVTVKNPDALAKLLCELFDWHIRWEGDAIHGGKTIHVGSDDSYLALYTPQKSIGADAGDSYTTPTGLNHIGVTVDNLDATEAKVLAHGYKTHSHADYDPGRRFYFDHADGLEIEVVCYGN